MKKIIKFILAVILILVPVKIKAEVDDSFILKSYNGDEFTIRREYMGNITYQPIYQVVSKITNGHAYSIDPLSNNISGVKKDAVESDHLSYKNIDLNDWIRINMLGYYGYLYPGHEHIKWYFLTQALIFNIIDKNASRFLYNLEKNEINNIYDNEIKELNSLVDRNLLLPNFDKDLIYFNEENILLDFNESIASYDYYYDKSQAEVMVDNNTLTIKPLIEGNIAIEFVKKNSQSIGNVYLYQFPGYQDYIVVNSNYPLTKTINFEVLKKSLSENVIENNIANEETNEDKKSEKNKNIEINETYEEKKYYQLPNTWEITIS